MLLQGIFFTIGSPLVWLLTLVHNWRMERQWWLSSLCDKPAHDRRVKQVAQAVAEAQGAKGGGIFMARSPKEKMTSRFPTGHKRKTISTKHMTNIVEVDLAAGTIVVEPRVTVRQITTLLLPLEHSIAVVPELDELTIGGLVMGCGIESSSWRYGMLNEICTSHTLITAEGTVIEVTRESHPELWAALPWSHGTLGILVASTIRLVPLTKRKSVRLEYTPLVVSDPDELPQLIATTLDEWTSASQRKSAPYEFVEGVVYSDREAMLYRGTLCDAPAGSLTRLNGWSDLYFARWLQSRRSTDSDVVSIEDYYFRHSKGIFWEMEYLQRWSSSAWFRNSLGWTTPMSINLFKRAMPNWVLQHYSDNHIVQDYLVPLSSLASLMEIARAELEVYPIWLCPYVLHHRPGALMSVKARHNSEEMYIDVGY